MSIKSTMENDLGIPLANLTDTKIWIQRKLDISDTFWDQLINKYSLRLGKFVVGDMIRVTDKFSYTVQTNLGIVLWFDDTWKGLRSSRMRVDFSGRQLDVESPVEFVKTCSDQELLVHSDYFIRYLPYLRFLARHVDYEVPRGRNLYGEEMAKVATHRLKKMLHPGYNRDSGLDSLQRRTIKNILRDRAKEEALKKRPTEPRKRKSKE